jgi:hypothetical protein
MKIWVLIHLVVEHPIITGVVIALIVVGFVLSVLLEGKKK